METKKDNIYAATEVNLIVEEKSPDFYVVATGKFWVLNIATFGLYRTYWFYKNWALYKRSTGENVWPVPRAIFSIFFAHRLCKNIDSRILGNGIVYAWPWKAVANTYVLIAIFGFICDRLAFNGSGSPFSDLLSLLALPITSLALWRIQEAANAACGEPTGDSNQKITGLNVLWIAFGALCWSLAFMGIFSR